MKIIEELLLTETFSKLHGWTLKDFIEEEIRVRESEEQNWFRAGRSCVDNIFCLKQMAGKKWKWETKFFSFLSILQRHRVMYQ